MCEEAIRLARLLARLMPDEPEVLGLLVLLLVTDARRPARVADDGALVSLEEQARSRWDAALIGEGVAMLERALRLGRYGPYVVQAAIAALHSRAPIWEATDWSQIARLHAELARLDPSPGGAAAPRRRRGGRRGGLRDSDRAGRQRHAARRARAQARPPLVGRASLRRSRQNAMSAASER